LCEFVFKTKREKKIEEEERNDLPPYHVLVKIVGELALKNEKLEEKLHTLEQSIPKKKNRIQPIQWLTTQTQETGIQSFFSELHTKIHVTPDHIEQLMDKKFKVTTLILKLLEQLQKIPYPMIPLACFTEKNNVLYIYNSTGNEGEPKWMELEKEDLTKFLNQIDRKIWREFRQWQQNNLQAINISEKLSIKRDEMQSKIAGMDYKDFGVLNKVKTHLYGLLKCDFYKKTSEEES
jgi:hypothetical protein